jgi:nicotinamidase-related amidase
MSKITLPIRFMSNDAVGHLSDTIVLAPGNSALLLVDCDGDCDELGNQVIHDRISPALRAARLSGIKPIFIYGDGWLPDGANSLAAEYHRTRRGLPAHQEQWRPYTPTWIEAIEPITSEPLIGKKAQNAFVGTYLDIYLRSHNINTLLLAGFSFKSCLFYTAVGAFERNYRAILLRDGTDLPGSNEFADTVDTSLPEGGWVRTILTRLIEDHLGYSSTCAELIAACRSIS